VHKYDGQYQKCTHSVSIRRVEPYVIEAHKQFIKTTSNFILCQQPTVKIGDKLRDELTLWIVSIHRQHYSQLGNLMSVWSNVQLIQ